MLIHLGGCDVINTNVIGALYTKSTFTKSKDVNISVFLNLSSSSQKLLFFFPLFLSFLIRINKCVIRSIKMETRLSKRSETLETLVGGWGGVRLFFLSFFLWVVLAI